MSFRSNLPGAGYGLLAFGAYAGYDAAAKFLGGDYHPLQVIAMASAFTMPLLLAQAALNRDGGSLRPVRPGLMALRAAGTVVNFVTGVTAFTMLPLAEAYVIFFMMPIFIALLAIPFLGEKLDIVRGLAVLLGLAGVVIALDPTATRLGLGHVMALSGATIGAMNYVIIRKTGAVERTAAMLIWPQLALFVVVMAALPFVYRPMPLPHVGVSAIMAVVLVIGMTAIIAAYRRARAVVVAPMQYSQILWAALFGVFLFDEPMQARTVLGALLIAAAGMIIVARQDQAATPEPA